MGLATIDADLKFVALGGVWLDEICVPGKETLFDVPGGSVPFGDTSSPPVKYQVSWLMRSDSYFWRSTILAGHVQVYRPHRQSWT